MDSRHWVCDLLGCRLQGLLLLGHHQSPRQVGLVFVSERFVPGTSLFPASVLHFQLCLAAFPSLVLQRLEGCTAISWVGGSLPHRNSRAYL